MPEILNEIDPASKQPAEEPPLSIRRLEELNRKVSQLSEFVETAARNATAVHEVEQGLWSQLLDLGRGMIEQFFELAGDGDLGPEVQLPEGGTLRRLPEPHARAYQSIFGHLEVSRVAYGTREGQKIEWVPLDQRLQLPESKFSYLLQDWDQHFAVEQPYAQVSATVQKILGFSQSVDSLERMNRQMANLVVDYWNGLETPPVSEEGELMIVTADGKGVPIRRSDPAPGDPAPSKGPKPGGKKMALVGATYTVDRFPRTAQEVVDALFRKPRRPPPRDRPVPRHKRVRASLERDEVDRSEPANDEIFGWMSLEAEQRNPDGKQPLVLLMDGQAALWEAASEHLPEEAVQILDLLHVTPRLWRAAYLFHPEGSAGAARFVRQRVQRILNGEVRSVITGLRRMATVSGLRGRKRKQLERICHYFENNQHRMRYHEYLAAGYPIATGVIEGACRHLVKDRLERAGMKWVMEGAQAMLDLRSIHLGDQWNEFQAFRIRKENERLYPRAVLTEAKEWRIAA